MQYKKKHLKPRIILIVPNFFWSDWDVNSRWDFIPYNLCIIGSMLKSFCDVAIIDANHENLTDEQLSNRITEFGPDIIGITSLMDQYGVSGHRAALISKKASPQTPVVFGGVYATMNTKHVLQDQNIDFVIIGEGEYVFPKLVCSLLDGSSLPERGVAFRKGIEIVDTGHAKRIDNLDELPMPEYGLINYPSYVMNYPERPSVDMPPKLPYARILTSRGCPFGCVFCQVEHIAGKKFRSRSAENILSEIAWLKSEYGIKSIIFDDDNLFIDEIRARNIFEGMVRNGLAMPWVSIATAAFRLNEKMIDLMVNSGCEYIDIAIESGCQRVLKEIIGKPLDLKHAERIIDYARAKGIFVATNFVIGFPGETWGEIRETIAFAERINVDYVKIFTAVPLPQTRLWKLCEDTGSFLKNKSNNLAFWNRGHIETDQFRARDLTILRAYEWDRINFTDENKAKRIAKRMHITMDDLFKIRQTTIRSVAEGSV